LAVKQGFVEQVVSDPALVGRVVAVLVLLGASMVAAVVGYDWIRSQVVGQMVEESIEQVTSLADQPWYMFPILIFENNARLAIVTALLSPVFIIPLFIIAFNGMVVGYVVVEAIIAGFGVKGLLTGVEGPGRIIFAFLAPHGSIEIPALAVAASTMFYLVDKARGVPVSFLRVLARNLALSILILAVAAIVETTITVAYGIIVAFI